MSKVEEMTAFIAACRASGRSIEQYCSEHGLSTAKYYYWRKRLEKPGDFLAPGGFMELKPIAGPELWVELPGGLKFSLPGGSLTQMAKLLLQMDRDHA